MRRYLCELHSPVGKVLYSATGDNLDAVFEAMRPSVVICGEAFDKGCLDLMPGYSLTILRNKVETPS